MAGTIADDTSLTPGMAASRPVNCSWKLAVAWSVYLLSLGISEKVNRWSALIPKSTLERLTRVLPNRPAEISSSSEIAICAVTSVLRKTFADAVGDAWPAWLFSDDTRSALDDCSAG